MVGRIEPAEDGDRVVAARAVPAGQDRREIRRRRSRSRPRRRRSGGPRAGTISAGRDGSSGVRDEALGREDLEAVGEVEPPAEPCLGDERVEHRVRPLVDAGVGRRSRVIVTAAFLPAYQLLNAFGLDRRELILVRRGGLLVDDLEEVEPVVRDRRRCR